jgi:non-specific serine/threonine protein kinase
VATKQALGNVPAELTSFVGRRHELADTKRLLSAYRAVTLTGPGGVGKTRLAFRVGAQHSRAFRDGMWLVELAELRDPTLLANTVADKLGLRDQSGRPALATVVAYLQGKMALLVLDNCEHLIDECAAFVSTVLRTCPEMKVLSTSRQSLRIPGEGVLPVRALPLPDTGGKWSVERLAANDAVCLFADRASAVQPHFTISEGNAAVLARVCRHLDGIPLAIELAAVWVRTLSLEQIEQRLSKRYRLLAAQHRSKPERHRTLRALIDWSHDLCSHHERLVWSRASVFSGSFDLDAAESVCSGDGVEPGLIIDVVDALVDKSVFVREEQEGIARYRMLETVREYGQDRLAEAGDLLRVRRRHRDWYAALAARFDAEWLSTQQVSWVHRLRRDHANLRVALEFCVTQPGQARTGMRMMDLIQDHWLMGGFLAEMRHWLDRALAADTEPSPERASALRLNGRFAVLRGERDLAAALLAEAGELARQLDLDAEVAYVQATQGMAAVLTGDAEKAPAPFDGALAYFRAAGDTRGQLLTLFALGYALAVQRLDRAWTVLEECITLSTQCGEIFYRSRAFWILAHAVHGGLDRAEAAAHEALRFQRLLDDKVGIAHSVETLACIAGRNEQHTRAATLFGAADAVWRTVSSSPAYYSTFEGPHNDYVASARRALGDTAFDKAHERGRDLPADVAIGYALSQQTTPKVQPVQEVPASGTATGALTPRERQVAALVAQGMTNNEIANKLVISQRTAESHVEHILAKLGLTNRTQIATWIAGKK